MTTNTLPAATTLGPVHLVVSDLDRSIAWYVDRVGLSLLDREGAVARLGAGDETLLVLTGDPGAPSPRGVAGLFHVAILVPTRADLGRVLRHLVRTRTPMQGASDHGVSEALYLDDPDGNGLEIYRDRPRDDWPRAKGELRMFTQALDAEGVLAAAEGEPESPAMPAGTRVGHVHLQVVDLDTAERFYTGVLGFDLVQRYGPGAAFVSAGGYHHHLGLNTWNGARGPAPEGAIGLASFEVRVPAAAALDAVAQRASGAGVASERRDGALVLRDPSGNRVRVVANA